MKMKKILAAGLAVVTMAAAVPLGSVQDFIDDFSLTASARGGVVDSGNCGTAEHESEVTWELTETGGTVTYNNGSGDVTESALKLTISGTGEMADYNNMDAIPWHNQYRKRITQVEIGNTVTKIGKWAFRNCESLSDVSVPDGVTSIGESAFFNCTSLTSIVLPDTITIMGKSVFSTCSSLKNVNIPNQITSINDKTFCLCRALESITIPKRCNNLGVFMFQFCTSLKTVIFEGSIANTTIGTGVFSTCPALTTIYSADESGQAVTSTTVKTTKHSGCGKCGATDSDPVYWVLAENGTLPNTTTTAYKLYIFGTGAMMKCSEYREDNQSTVPNAPWFTYVQFITEIEMSDDITHIGDYAFYNCDEITKITISNKVTSIGDKAFFNCTHLTKVTFEDEKNITAWGNRIFDGYNAINKVNFKYKSSTLDKELTGLFPENCTFTYLENDVHSAPPYETYEQNGLTFHLWDDHAELAECDTTAKTVTIPAEFEGLPVTEIGENAFNSCKNLTEVIIPESVTTIGQSAFWGCTSLESVTIPESVTEIGKDIFKKCSALKEVKGYNGSAAEKYANDKEIEFVPVGEPVVTATTTEAVTTTTTTTTTVSTTTSNTTTAETTTVTTTTAQPKKPSAPTNITVSENGTVTWTASDNATDYKVFKKYGDDTYHSGWIKDTSYTFSGVPTVDYEVYVAAKNDYGTAWSEHITVKVKDPLGKVTKAAVSNGTVSWKSQQGAVAYKVAKIVNGKTYYGKKITDTTYTFKNMPKTDYKIFVVAFDKNGKRTWGRKISVSAE